MTVLGPIRRKSRGGRKRVNLALQGGGAHGAFTWGVLDALLEDGRLEFEAISGTSAGAMNAAIMASGLCKGGAQGARDALRAFWRDVAVDGHIPDSARGVVEMMLTPWRIGVAAGQNLFEATRNVFSPYELNPLDINPLRGVVEGHIDFDALRTHEGPQLFIAATSVRSGKIRVFTRAEVSADVLMASAALPFLFRAVEVEGEPYWDGGFMGNPALFPFFTHTDVEDVVLVQINPIEREDVPENAVDIMERVNEISFNGPLLNEFRAIEFVARLIEAGALRGSRYKSIRMHRIEDQSRLGDFGSASKLKANWAFFAQLHEIGRDAAFRFLEAHFEAIGERGTLDLRAAIDPLHGVKGKKG